jgi:hypothetical protein
VPTFLTYHDAADEHGRHEQPTHPIQALVFPSKGSTGWPASRSATKKSELQRVPAEHVAEDESETLQPNAGDSVLISGRAVAAARNVAPKTTPLMPQSSASWLPLRFSNTPATSVTIVLNLADDETTARAQCRHLMALAYKVVSRAFGHDRQEAGR